MVVDFILDLFWNWIKGSKDIAIMYVGDFFMVVLWANLCLVLTLSHTHGVQRRLMKSMHMINTIHAHTIKHMQSKHLQSSSREEHSSILIVNISIQQWFYINHWKGKSSKWSIVKHQNLQIIYYLQKFFVSVKSNQMELLQFSGAFSVDPNIQDSL